MLNQIPKLILVVFLVNISKNANSQVGYFGSTFGFDLRVNIAPSYRQTVSYDSINNHVIKKPRVANVGFQIGLFSITNYRSEWGFGLEYSKLDLYTQGVSVLSRYHFGSGNFADDYFDFFENPEIKYLGLSAYYKFYLNRRKLPIGYFLRLDFKIGRSTYIAEVAPVFGHVKGIVDSTWFSETREIALIDNYDNVHDVKTSVNTFFCNLAIGRTFPITHFFSASVSASAPIFGFNDAIYGPRDFYKDNNLRDEQVVWFSRSSWRKIIFHTVSKYNGPSFDFTLKFYI